MKNKHKIENSWVGETDKKREEHTDICELLYVSLLIFGIFMDVHCIMKINKY